MEERQQTKIWRSGVKVHEMNSESLRKMWVENLSEVQRAVIAGAGIYPFLKAVTYRCDGALCSAVIDFMVDGQLTVGENRMQITEEHIREATGLPNSGKCVSPSRDYNRAEIMMRFTGSEKGASGSGLLVDKILDPSMQFACKFLACKLLGVKTPGTIPYKYVATAIEVSQGVCFNWCKFVKERILEQIESVQKRRTSSFDYATILQYLALKAFGEFWIPRSTISDGDPGINTYDVLGRDVGRSKDEKKKGGVGISHILLNIMKYHGQRVLSGDGREEQDLDSLERLSREKSMWEVEKMNLESEKERLHMENTRLEAALRQEKEELQMRIASLEAALRQEIQTIASASVEKTELQRRIASLETALGELQAKLKKISEFMKMEVANI